MLTTSQVALHTNLKLPDPSSHGLESDTDNLIWWTKTASKHNLAATFDFKFTSADNPWEITDRLPVWNSAFTELGLNLRRDDAKKQYSREEMLDFRQMYFYRYIKKHVFEHNDYRSLETDWSQRLGYYLPSRRVRGFVSVGKGQWRIGHSIDDLSSDSDDSACSDSESGSDSPGSNQDEGEDTSIE